MVKLTLEYMKELAKEKDGMCLSDKYLNAKTSIKWKCNKDGCVWLAPYCNIYSGHWCPECGGTKKLTLDFVKKFIEKRKGNLLSKDYVNQDSRLNIKCEKGHIWETSFMSIQNGNWCSVCSKNKKLTIDDMHKIAKKNNGKCLSTIYVNAQSPIHWECEEGHKWDARYYNVYLGKWCPDCSIGKTEKLCRKYIEDITKKKFVKLRPIWLKGLELDGYNEDLKLAFEYNGKQHYVFTPFMHNHDTKEFINQQKRDKMKKILCRNNGIKLIEIPYRYNHLDTSKLYKFIDKEIKKYGI